MTNSILGTFAIPFEHGLLVVEDSTAKALHDDWDAATQAVHVDENSVYVGVQGADDGAVQVEVRDGRRSDRISPELISRFEGSLEVPSRVLRVSDSDDLAVLSFPVARGQVDVKIFVDDDRWPARVIVTIE